MPQHAIADDVDVVKPVEDVANLLARKPLHVCWGPCQSDGSIWTADQHALGGLTAIECLIRLIPPDSSTAAHGLKELLAVSAQRIGGLIEVWASDGAILALNVVMEVILGE